MSRILKKYSHKYEFLKLEYEDFQEQFDEYQVVWKDLFSEYFNNIKAEVWVNEETGEIRDKPPGEEEPNTKVEKELKVKKLYRKASRIAHPDKGGTEEDFDYIKKCYDNNDLLGLINFASQNNIEVEVTEEDENLLESSCKRFQEKINKVRSTLIWNFFNGNDNMKRGVIQQLERNHNIEIDQKKVLEKLENSR